jgi:hypothetical protein
MAKNRLHKYLWTSFNLGTGVIVGVTLVIIFSISQKINAASPLLWSFAYYVIGGLLGFIFSVPKIISDTPQVTNITSSQQRTLFKKVEENTNLTQISDWLTKILIGAGLVQLKEAPGFILKVARVMAEGLRKVAPKVETVDEFTIFCAAIILFFLTWGFISGYIVMKLVLTEQFADSDILDSEEENKNGTDN